jgi:hypothetical protein
MSSRAMKVYKGAVQKTSDAMSWAKEQVDRDRRQTADYKARQSAKSRPAESSPSRTPPTEPTPFRAARKLKHKSAEAIREIEGG